MRVTDPSAFALAHYDLFMKLLQALHEHMFAFQSSCFSKWSDRFAAHDVHVVHCHGVASRTAGRVSKLASILLSARSKRCDGSVSYESANEARGDARLGRTSLAMTRAGGAGCLRL